MPKPKKGSQLPRETLAKNVKFLMDQNDNETEASLAKRSGVSQKTVNNIINNRTSVQLDSVEAIAAAYGLNGWQLIIPGLPAELLSSGTIAKMYDDYANSSSEGRKHIEQVAEREAAYNGSSGQ